MAVEEIIFIFWIISSIILNISFDRYIARKHAGGIGGGIDILHINAYLYITIA